MKKKSLSSFRKQAALQLMDKHRVDALFVEDPVDLFFWTDVHLSMGSLLITRRSVKLFVDGRYLQLCQERSSIPPRSHKSLALPDCRVGFDASTTSYERFLKIKKKGAKTLKGIENLGQQLRLIKAPEEVERIQKACQLALQAMDHVKAHLKKGVSEKEIADAVEFFFKKRGATLSFNPIIAFGPSSAMPHSQPTDRLLQCNDIALVDIGCCLDGYCSDMTRLFFIGEKNPKHVALYKGAQAALEGALAIAKAGVTPHALDQAAKKGLAEQGFGPYPHSLGHGVGVEVHELPRIAENARDPLPVGAVVTIEPGVYIEGLGGVRLENQILIEEDGYTNLTPYPFESL